MIVVVYNRLLLNRLRFALHYRYYSTLLGGFDPISGPVDMGGWDNSVSNVVIEDARPLVSDNSAAMTNDNVYMNNDNSVYMNNDSEVPMGYSHVGVDIRLIVNGSLEYSVMCNDIMYTLVNLRGIINKPYALWNVSIFLLYSSSNVLDDCKHMSVISTADREVLGSLRAKWVNNKRSYYTHIEDRRALTPLLDSSGYLLDISKMVLKAKNIKTEKLLRKCKELYEALEEYKGLDVMDHLLPGYKINDPLRTDIDNFVRKELSRMRILHTIDTKRIILNKNNSNLFLAPPPPDSIKEYVGFTAELKNRLTLYLNELRTVKNKANPSNKIQNNKEVTVDPKDNLKTNVIHPSKFSFGDASEEATEEDSEDAAGEDCEEATEEEIEEATEENSEEAAKVNSEYPSEPARESSWEVVSESYGPVYINPETEIHEKTKESVELASHTEVKKK